MKKNEKAFINLVKQKVFKIYKNGKIYRCKIKNQYTPKYEDCKSRLMNQKVGKGYIQISFGSRKKIMRILVHRAIWLYFNDDIPERLEPNHKNGIKDDNRLSNLELVTHKGNMQHAYKIGLLKSRVGENNGCHKLTNKKVLKIRKLIKQGVLQYKIAKIFNVGRSIISEINTGNSWSHVT